MGHHITHLTGLAYTRRKTRLIYGGVLRERLPALPVGKIRQRGIVHRAQQAPANRRGICLSAGSGAHVGHIARSGLMADKVQNIITFQNTQVRRDLCFIAQGREDGARNGGDRLLVQVGKPKVQNARSKCKGIGLLCLANEFHLAQGVNQSEGRRTAKFHRAGDITQRHGRFCRSENFENAQPPMKTGNEIDIMVGRFGHRRLVSIFCSLVFNMQNGPTQWRARHE